MNYTNMYNALNTQATEVDSNLTLPTKVQSLIAEGYTLFSVNTNNVLKLPRYDLYKGTPDVAPQIACWIDNGQSV